MWRIWITKSIPLLFHSNILTRWDLTVIMSLYLFEIHIFCLLIMLLCVIRTTTVLLYCLHCPKSNPNFRDILWNVVENMILHELLRIVPRFPCYISCYIAGNRFSLGQCRENCDPSLNAIFTTHNRIIAKNCTDQAQKWPQEKRRFYKRQGVGYLAEMWWTLCWAWLSPPTQRAAFHSSCPLSTPGPPGRQWRPSPARRPPWPPGTWPCGRSAGPDPVARPCWREARRPPASTPSPRCCSAGSCRCWGWRRRPRSAIGFFPIIQWKVSYFLW